MFLTCVFTVLTETYSRDAISTLDSVPCRYRSTVSSRSVSGSTYEPAGRVRPVRGGTTPLLVGAAGAGIGGRAPTTRRDTALPGGAGAVRFPQGWSPAATGRRS